MAHTVALASRASSTRSRYRSLVQRLIRVLVSSQGVPQLQQFHDEVSDLIYGNPLEETCPCTAQHNLTVT